MWYEWSVAAAVRQSVISYSYLCMNAIKMPCLQTGEDGIVSAAFDCIGTTDKYYVEFGVEDGTECTTRLLRERFGWRGLMMDGSHENKTINLNKEWMTSSNIVSLFAKHGVPREFDHMTIDIDLNTLWVMQVSLRADIEK